jgi:glycosyltransferase involved in cell wall biosynthesis
MTDPSLGDRPDISVIIPTYNRSGLLRQAVDSCLAQTGVRLEVLVIDDASPDDTPVVLAGYGRSVRTVRLEENHGNGGYGRNVGLPLARGRYVKFLDHDDVLEPGSLAREYATALAQDADMVMSGWGVCSIDASGRVIEGSRRTHEPPPPDQVIEAILGARKVPYIAAVLYRRTYVEGMEWDRAVTIIDDFDWFCRAALKGGRIAVAPGVSYWWRQNPAGIQAAQSENPWNFLESAYIRDTIYGKVEALLSARGELTTPRRAALAQLYYRGLRAFGRFDPAHYRRALAHVLELQPAFRPSVESEYNPAIRHACGVAGVRAALAAYLLVRRALDQLAPKRGRLSYFSTATIPRDAGPNP